MVKLTDQVRDLLHASGCDLVGVANVERFGEAPEGRRPRYILPTARSVVVGVVHILDSVCDDLPERGTHPGPWGFIIPVVTEDLPQRGFFS